MSARFDQPLIAVDVVALTYSPVSGLLIALPSRAVAPAAGERALPGVLLNGAERLDDAARRALSTKASVSATGITHLTQIGAFDRPGRETRHHAISIGFLAVIRPVNHDDLIPATDISNLPFFHNDIVDRALEHARNLLWTDVEFTRALLGTSFGTNTAADLSEALTGVRPRPSTLNRDLHSSPSLVKLDGVWPNDNGRPASAWTWASADAENLDT
jgi:ADP-ribose pyrophosphatase YjhB (NUDIX family)